jgi:hypothetical protein
MKILLTGLTMDNFTGQPMSTYESARVLSKDHDVTVVCIESHWTDNELKQNLEALGVKCQYNWEEEYDLIIASEWCPNIKGFKINTVRGIGKSETPIPNCDFYSCIRPDVQEHIIKEHGIPEEKTKVIYNGVDLERFKPIVKTPRDYIRIVVPCTIDNLRRHFIEYLLTIATKDRQIFVYAPRQDYIIQSNPYFHVEKPTFHMEKIIGDSDLVMGIYLGRVNLEARACGVPSIMFDPVTLFAEKFEIKDEDFLEHHDIKNTVKKLLNIYETRK